MKKVTALIVALVVSACAGVFAGDWEPGKNGLQFEAGFSKNTVIGSGHASSAFYEVDGGFQHAFTDWFAVEGGLRLGLDCIDIDYDYKNPITGNYNTVNVSESGFAFQPYAGVWFKRFHINFAYNVSKIDGETCKGSITRLGWNPRITKIGPGTIGVDFGFNISNVDYNSQSTPFGIYVCASYNIGL